MATKNPFREAYSRVYKMIQDRRFHEAEQEIERIENHSSETIEEQNNWLRIGGHLRANVCQLQGQFNEAKGILLNSRASYGENAHLLIELSIAHYQLGEWEQWRASYDDLQGALDGIPKIGLETRMQCYLNLGKFLEEEAKVCYAKQYYQNVCDMAENNHKELFFDASLQKLRLTATFGEKEEVGSLYTQFLQLTKSQVNCDFQVEVEHTLMLAELCLVGPSHAWTRVKNALENPNLVSGDEGLILYDFIEECLIRNYPISDEMTECCARVKPHDAYEELLQSIVLVNHCKMSLEEISDLSSKTSWACYLRILTLAMEIFPHLQLELKNKIHLLLSALPSPSRHLWIQRLDKYLRTSKKTVVYNPETRHLHFEGKSVDLSRKRGMLTFIEIMSRSQNESVELMIQKIWDSDFSPDHFHRLRMTAHRMNELLFDLTSVKKPIQVSSDFVRVSADLEFVRMSTENEL